MAKLGDICIIQSGGTPSRAEQSYWNNGTIPWVKISDIKGKYLNKTEEFITKEGLENSSAKIFQKGTILYTIFATLGEVSILEIAASTNQAIAGLSINNECVDVNYLYHFLVSLKSLVNSVGRGVAQNNINMKILKDFDVPLPSLEKQKKIATVLDKISRLIADQNKQLLKLDDLIKSRFIELFSDAASAKFPVVNLMDVTEEFFAGGDKPADISLLKIGEYKYPVFANGYENEGFQCYAKTYRVAKEAVTVSARGTIGYCFIRNPFFTPVVRLVTLVPNEKVSVVYLKYAIDTMDIDSSGTSQAQLTVPNFKKKSIVLPPIDLQNEFAAFVEQTDKLKLEIKQSLEKLETQKKSLMQKYFG